MPRSTAKIILSRITGFIFFLILLAIANMLIGSVHNETYRSIIFFFNESLLLLLILMLLGMVNDIFWNMNFPFNIIAPITSAVLSFCVLTFMYALWIFLDQYIQSGMTIPIGLLKIVVFFIVLLAGYLAILVRGGKPKSDWEDKWKERRQARWLREKERLQRRLNRIDRHVKNKEEVDWEDVGEEFKLAFYNLGKSINKSFENNKKPKEKRRKRRQ